MTCMGVGIGIGFPSGSPAYDLSALSFSYWDAADATESAGNLVTMPWRKNTHSLGAVVPSGNAPAVSGGQLVFDSSNSEAAAATASNLASFATNADAFAIAVVTPTTAINGTSTNTYQNGAPFLDSSGYFGLTVRQTSAPNGVVHGYAFTSSEQREPAAGVAFSLGVEHVIAYRINGGTARFSIDGGAESSSAVGNIGALSGGLRWGRGTVSFFSGSIRRFGLGRIATLGADNWAALLANFATAP